MIRKMGIKGYNCKVKLKGFLNHICVVFLLFVGKQTLYAQNYPVQANLNLIAPYSAQLSTYPAYPQSLSIQLLNKDFATPQINVYLKLNIEGPGISIGTAPFFKPNSPINLVAGSPTLLGGADIAYLFNTDNLIFSGLNKTKFINEGSLLPEGIYQFSITAYYFDNNAQVSNIGISTVTLFKHQPPIINLPANGSFLDIKQPQQLFIQFTPRHTAAPSLQGKISYKIKLIEVQPYGRNANEAMQSTIVPLYETFTSSTSILYGAGEPPLIEGRKYALQVQAIDANGYNIFDNNGYSPVHEFVYGKQCPIPSEFTAQKGDGTSIDIKWQANTQHKSYIVNYRQKGKGENKTEMVFSNGLTLYNLLPKTTYLISLVGLCNEGTSEATQELSITTDTAKSSYQQWAATNCGKPLPSIDLSNTKPLLGLNTGETIQAADFDIKIIAITSLGNGYYTGSGLVTLPFTGKVPLPCSFERILLNTDKRMIEGKISLLQAPLMLSNRTFTNVAKMWRQLFGSNWNKYETQKYEGNINQINVNETDGTITIEGSAGTKKIKTGQNIEITDSKGKTWYISPAGKLSPAEGPKTNPIVKDIATGEGTPSSLPSGMAKVYFDAPLAESFDAYQHQALTAGSQYDALDCADTAYYAAWKLAQAGKTFKLTATLVQGTYMPCPLDSVKFARSDGTLLPFTRQGNEFTIQATGRMHLYADAVWAIANYALNKESKPERWLLGKLNIINTDIKKMNVVLVPVNGIGAAADVERLKKEIKLKFDLYNIEVALKKDNNIQINDYKPQTELIEVSKTVLNLGYKYQIQRFIDAYKTKYSHLANRYNNDTAYLFLLNKATENTEGYMGLGEQFGFIFLAGATTPKTHTICHELGHGTLGLGHTFENDITLSGKSQNLMDYTAPFSLLNYKQWVAVHDPNIKIKLLENEKKGSYVKINTSELPDSFKNKDKTITFMCASGKPITLPKDIKSFRISTGDPLFIDEKLIFEIVPIGTLMGFEYNEKYYRYRGSSINNFPVFSYFYYYDENKKEVKFYDTLTSKIKPKSVIVGLPFLKDSFKVYTKIFKLKNEITIEIKDTNYTGFGKCISDFNVVDLIYPDGDISYTQQTNSVKGFTLNQIYEVDFNEYGKDVLRKKYNYSNNSDPLSPIIIGQAFWLNAIDNYTNETIFCYSEIDQKISILKNLNTVNNLKWEDKSGVYSNKEIEEKRKQNQQEARYNELNIYYSYREYIKNYRKIINKTERIEAIINNCSTSSLLFDSLTKFNQFNDCQFKNINSKNRIKAISILLNNKNWLGDNSYENLIIKLFNTESNAKDFLNLLKNDNTGILSKIQSNFQLDNYLSIFNLISKIYINGVEYVDILKEKNEIINNLKNYTYTSDLVKHKIIPWYNQGFLKRFSSFNELNTNYNYDNLSINNNGEISFEIKPNNLLMSAKSSVVNYKPFELVRLLLLSDEENLNAKVGDELYIPAILLAEIITKKGSRDAFNAVSAACLLSPFSGASKLFVTLDISFNTSALIIDSYKKDLETTENGKVFIKAYNTFGSALLLYTASRLGISAFKISVPIFKSAYKKYTTLKEYLNYKALNPTKAKEFEASIDNLIKCADEAVNGAGKLSKVLAKLDNLPDAKAFVNSLDEVADASLLNKIDNLSETQLKGLNDFYKTRQSPAGFSTTDYNFTANKKLRNGDQASMTFKNGFPEFHNSTYCPSMSYGNGTKGKFKFQSENLNLDNYSTHFDMANNSLLEKMGLTKSSPKNAGFYEKGNYRWDGSSSQFELKNANGTYEKYTWHHFEDGKTMIPVLSDAHTGSLGGFVHSGGNSIFKNNIKGVFQFSAF